MEKGYHSKIYFKKPDREYLMNKTLLVFRNEFVSTVKSKSFIFTLLLLPLIGFVVMLIIGNSQKEGANSFANQIFITENQVNIMGIVDQSQLISFIPVEHNEQLKLYTNQQKAEEDLHSGQISGFYLVEPDYIQTGKIILFKRDFNPLSNEKNNHLLENLLVNQLLSTHPQLSKRIENPLILETTILSPELQRDPESSLTFFLPYIVTMIFYVVILSSSSLMLNSVTKEKSNRMMEILMTSVDPMQMLTGKIIALGLIGLLQTIIWSGSGYLLLRLSGQTLNVSAAFQLPPSILAWGIVFFLSGYAVYASLMAGVGALVPNLREASQATTLVVIPLVIPMALISVIVENPNGLVAIIFSLFPLTAPVTMMTRLAAGNVPLWQIILAVILLFSTAYLVIRSVSKFFRAQNLLSGKEFKVITLLKAFTGKF
jgi:ABC-2 type transport system permease protein